MTTSMAEKSAANDFQRMTVIAGMMTLGLTEKQAEVYRYFLESTLRDGYQPSMVEASDYFGMTSSNAIICHLVALEKKGWIGRSESNHRVVRFLRQLDGRPFHGFVCKEKPDGR